VNECTTLQNPLHQNALSALFISGIIGHPL
jgi:hypothetical protein